jgi:hypothetical protein
LSASSSISGSPISYSGGGYGNSDAGAINATGYSIANSYIGNYGFGANGTGIGAGFLGNQGVVIVRYLL